jgi:hypothetical protein
MVKFTFIPFTDGRLTPDLKAKFLRVGQLVNWEYSDASGTYTGLVVIGEKQIPGGFQSFADVTIDLGSREIPIEKIREVSAIVNGEFQKQAVIGTKKK